MQVGCGVCGRAGEIIPRKPLAFWNLRGLAIEDEIAAEASNARGEATYDSHDALYPSKHIFRTDSARPQQIACPPDGQAMPGDFVAVNRHRKRLDVRLGLSLWVFGTALERIETLHPQPFGNGRSVYSLCTRCVQPVYVLCLGQNRLTAALTQTARE